VTTDSYRIGAQQQLNTFGKILGAPVHVAKNGEELREVLTALRDKSLILIDTAGMSQRDVRLSEQLSMLYQTGLPVRSYAVLSASSQRRSLEEVMHTFNKVELEGAILTKLDETTGLGEALSVVVQHRLPVAYISDGQRVPEDLHPARSNNLVNRSLSLMQDFGERPSQQQLASAFGSMAG
jgi:flagellar biosynthesis protein FlhF